MAYNSLLSVKISKFFDENKIKAKFSLIEAFTDAPMDQNLEIC